MYKQYNKNVLDFFFFEKIFDACLFKIHPQCSEIVVARIGF